SWKDNSDNEDKFVIERSVDSAPFAVLGEVETNVSTYTDEVEVGKDYAYRVRAVNEFGSSDFSNVVTFSPRVPNAPTELKLGAIVTAAISGILALLALFFRKKKE